MILLFLLVSFLGFMPSFGSFKLTDRSLDYLYTEFDGFPRVVIRLSFDSGEVVDSIVAGSWQV